MPNLFSQFTYISYRCDISYNAFMFYIIFSLKFSFSTFHVFFIDFSNTSYFAFYRIIDSSTFSIYTFSFLIFCFPVIFFFLSHVSIFFVSSGFSFVSLAGLFILTFSSCYAHVYIQTEVHKRYCIFI